MGRLIALSGVDCAGKSTQLELLRQHFISQGLTCAVFWYRPGYSRMLGACKDIVRGIAGALRKRDAEDHKSQDGTVPSPSPLESGSNSPTRTLARSLWVASAVVDSIVQWAANLRILMARHDVVLCDRYFWDGLPDLFFKFPHSGWGSAALLAASVLFPRPDRALLLWIPPEEMAVRAATKDEPFPDSDRVRELRRRFYAALRYLPRFVTIDASGTVMQTHQAILRAIA